VPSGLKQRMVQKMLAMVAQATQTCLSSLVSCGLRPYRCAVRTDALPTL
jgi:hypothetical protein